MLHQGKKIKDLAYTKGYKQKDLAKLRNVSEQAISWELKQEKLSPDTLKLYAQMLSVDYSDLLKEESTKNQQNSDDYLTKYLKAIEKIDFLQSVLLKNGIRVDIPNFNAGVSVSVLGNNKHIFFDK